MNKCVICRQKTKAMYNNSFPCCIPCKRKRIQKFLIHWHTSLHFREDKGFSIEEWAPYITIEAYKENNDR